MAGSAWVYALVTSGVEREIIPVDLNPACRNRDDRIFEASSR